MSSDLNDKLFEGELALLAKNGNSADTSCKESFEIEGVQLANKDVTKLAALLKTKYLKSLVLTGNELYQSHAVTLAESLKQNSFLTVLNLSNNQLGDGGVTAIASVLKFNTTLEELALRKCGFTADGAANIGVMLQKNKTLQILDVSRNTISSEGARDICHGIIETSIGDASQISSLKMNGCFIGDEGAKYVGSVISTVITLREVDLARNNIGEAGGKFIAHGLLRKNIAVTDDEDIEGIEALILDHNKLGDVGVSAIAKVLPANHSVKTLSLKDVGMRKEGLKVLLTNVEETDMVENLWIGENQVEEGHIGAPIVKMLKVMSTLRDLDLSGLSLSAEDVAQIADFLSTNNHRCRLAKLNLSNCSIDDDGAGEIAQGIKFNTDLKVLDVTANTFGVRGARLFSKTFERAKTLNTFRITGASRIGAQGENYLAQCLKVYKDLKIEGSATELDYLNDFANRGKAFITDPETNEISDWSPKAWEVVERGSGAIIGTVLERMSKDELKIFKENVLNKRNSVGQTMFEFVIRHSESPMIDTVNFFRYRCGIKWDDKCGSRASKAVAHKMKDSTDVTYRYVAANFCKDDRVKSLAKETNLYLSRYEQDTSRPQMSSLNMVRFLAKDKAADGGSEKVFVQEYRVDQDFQAEIHSRECMQDILKAGGPFAIFDFVLRQRCIHDESLVISYERNLFDLRHSMENLGVCAGYDIHQTIYLAKRSAECLGAVNNLGRIHGDFRPRNFFCVAKERMGDDPRGGGRKMLPAKWVLFDFSKSVAHGERLLLRDDSAYLPPEVAKVLFNSRMNEKQFPLANEKMDVWAFGVTLYQLLTGQHLFHMETPTDRLYRLRERNELMNWICLDARRQELILHRAYEAVWPNETMYKKLVEAAKDLVVWCLQGNPHNRPKFNDILQHPFFDYKKMIQYSDVDLLLGWYETMGLDKIKAHSKNKRVHAHIINTVKKECTDVTQTLLGYYKDAGCKATTDAKDSDLNIKERRDLVEKAQSLVILMDDECLYKVKHMQQLVWALDCPEVQSVIFLDISTANTGLKRFDIESFKTECADSKSKKIERLMKGLHPQTEYLRLKNLDIHVKEKRKNSKKGLKEVFEKTVFPEIERLTKKMMPFRTRLFQGQAMFDEMLTRAGFYPSSQTKSIALSDDTSKKEKTPANVLILWNEEADDHDLCTAVRKVRDNMFGMNKGNCRAFMLGSPNSVYKYFEREEEGALTTTVPTIIVSVVSEGFYSLFNKILIEINDGNGPIDSISIAYDGWSPTLESAEAEIANSGITSPKLLQAVKNPYSYIPLGHPRKGLDYEIKASYDYIVQESAQKYVIMS